MNDKETTVANMAHDDKIEFLSDLTSLLISLEKMGFISNLRLHYEIWLDGKLDKQFDILGIRTYDNKVGVEHLEEIHFNSDEGYFEFSDDYKDSGLSLRTVQKRTRKVSIKVADITDYSYNPKFGTLTVKTKPYRHTCHIGRLTFDDIAKFPNREVGIQVGKALFSVPLKELTTFLINNADLVELNSDDYPYEFGTVIQNIDDIPLGEE